MKILIISNSNNEDYKEDLVIAKSLRNDGNLVNIVNIDYHETLDDEYDVFLRRCTWEEDSKMLKKYLLDSNLLIKRLNKKKKKLINSGGVFDSNGKDYLLKLYNSGFPVVPSIDDINKLDILPDSKYYILKLKDSYDGIGMKK